MELVCAELSLRNRRNNLALITESFVKVLEMTAQLNVLKVGQITVAVETV